MHPRDCEHITQRLRGKGWTACVLPDNFSESGAICGGTSGCGSPIEVCVCSITFIAAYSIAGDRLSAQNIHILSAIRMIAHGVPGQVMVLHDFNMELDDLAEGGLVGKGSWCPFPGWGSPTVLLGRT